MGRASPYMLVLARIACGVRQVTRGLLSHAIVLQCAEPDYHDLEHLDDAVLDGGIAQE